MAEHVNDPWVKEATRLGYRSRAAFKLIELADKDKLFRPGMSVVDLGAAPGSWTQVLRQRLGPEGRHRRHRPAADGARCRRDVRAGRFSRGRRPRAARKCAGWAQGGPCGFGSFPQLVGSGGGGSGTFRASGRVGAGILQGRGCNPAAISSSKRSRVKVSPISGMRWRRISRKSTCASRRRRGTAAVRCMSSEKASKADVLNVFPAIVADGRHGAGIELAVLPASG